MKDVIIWAESSAEIEDFIELLTSESEFKIKEVFVAKRGVGNNYLKGVYYPYDLDRKGCLEKEIKAPNFIIKIVQWCSPDIIVSDNKGVLVSIETTYHILTYNNIAQRIPRQIKSAEEGIPNIIFQKIQNTNKDNIKAWFTKTFIKSWEIFNVPSIALVFTEQQFPEARKRLTKLVNSFVNKQYDNREIRESKELMLEYSSVYSKDSVLFTKKGMNRNWIREYKDRIIVIPGVNPDGTGWKTKGTGLIDPYPGLVKMSEILLCYNDQNKKDKKLITFFINLPRNFWWFVKYPDEIYYKIIKEFSDDVFYKGELEC